MGNDELLEKLDSAVRKHYHRDNSLARVVFRVLDETGISPETEIHRDYDGFSSAEYLIEKMFTEMILDGRPR